MNMSSLPAQSADRSKEEGPRQDAAVETTSTAIAPSSDSGCSVELVQVSCRASQLKKSGSEMMMTFRLQQSQQPRQQRSRSDSTLSSALVTPSTPPDIPGGETEVVSEPHPTPKLRGTKYVQLPPMPMKGTMEQSCFNVLVNPLAKSKQSETMTASPLTPEPMQTHSPTNAYYVRMLSPTSTQMQSSPGCMQMQSPLLMASPGGQVPLQQLQFFPAGFGWIPVIPMPLAKRGFGSFHSSNVEELVSLPKEQYRPPPFPVQLPVFRDKVPFGAEMKEKHFFLDKQCTFLNHGAFGAVIKEALHASLSWQMYCECQPLKFLDRELLPHLVCVIRRLAEFIDAEPTELVLVPNATTGINCVVQSVIKTFRPGDSIFILNLAYGATKKLLKHISSSVRVDEVEVTFPIKSTKQITKVVKESLRPGTKLAIFDHIPSNYGIILPVQELVSICHQRGIQVLIDGAHALGSQPLSMRNIKADYYVSNAHKWLCCPKGCAFLHVAKQHQSVIRPLVVSHGFGSGFTSEFIWTGLRDYSPFLALHTVLDFWEHYGVGEIRGYIHETARTAATLLQQAWGTSLLADPELFGQMVLVALPEGQQKQRSGVSYKNAEVVQNALFHEFNIEVPIKAIQGKLYVRISSHIYNELKEYRRLAEAMLKLLQHTDLL